jgi:4-aminobutyrate aminotransferase-like enzyme
MTADPQADGIRGPVPSIVTPPPGPRSRELLEGQSKVLYPGLAHGLGPFVIVRKQGDAIEDVDGNVYLDMISAMASVPLGASRPDVTKAAVEALRRYGNEDTHFYSHEFVLPLAEKLLELAPSNLSRVDIALNGTEAIEIAVKFMRRATGRPIVIGFMGGYHGESLVTSSVGAEIAELSRGTRGLAPGFVHVPYPNAYRTPFTPRPGGTGDGTIDYLRDHLLFHAVDPADVAGVLIEPVLGSGGCIAPPDAFWPALVDLCHEHDWMLVADEIKTGFGRTGQMFAVERWNVQPDLMCLGKAMGGGVMPIGAVLGTERAMGFEDVETGSTWSWLPAACAAALASLEVFEREPVLDNVRALEAAGRERLEALRDRTTKERNPRLQERVAWEALQRGLLADSSTTSYNLQPSLLTTPETLHRAIEILDGSIRAALQVGSGE